MIQSGLPNLLIKTCGVVAVGVGSYGLGRAVMDSVSYFSAGTQEEKTRAARDLKGDLFLLAASTPFAAFAGWATRVFQRAPFGRPGSREIDEDDLIHILPVQAPTRDDRQRVEDLWLKSDPRAFFHPAEGLPTDSAAIRSRLAEAKGNLREAKKKGDRILLAEAILDLAYAERDFAHLMRRNGRMAEAKAYDTSADVRLLLVRGKLRDLLHDMGSRL